MTTLEKAQAGKRIKIHQRSKPCNCGCGGTDTWHSKTATRAIRGIEVFDALQSVRDSEGRRTAVIATGTYKHQRGERPCGLFAMVHPTSQSIYQIFWQALEER